MPVWLTLTALRKLPWRWILSALAVVVAVAWIWAKIEAYGDAREAVGRATVEGLWGVEKAAAVKVAQKAETDRIASESATAARNQEIARVHAEKTASLAADNNRLERLLKSAIAPRPAAGSDSNTEAAGIPGATPASSPGSDEPPAAAAGIAADIAAALTEARQNAEQLDSLIAEIKPQL